MPRFSRFYSTTEAAAASGVFQLFPRELEEAPHFSSNDAEQLANLLDGTKISPTRPRNDINQPLFRPRPPIQSVERLFNAFSFSITQETVYRDKSVHYKSASEGSQEWKTRSRTPSSNGLSPRKYCMYPPTLDVKTEVSSDSDGPEDEVAHVIDPARQKHLKSRATHPDYYATYLQGVLQTMDKQFSKWSYNLNEGTTAIPFVMAQAPTETHRRLVKIDRKLWTTGDGDAAGGEEESQATTKALLERAQKGFKRISPSRVPGAAKNSSSSKVGFPPKDITSKRAALIVRSKAAKDSSLIASKSVGQRRSALHKNKNRRSIMPSPPPTTRKLGSMRKSESQVEQSKPTILILNPEEDNQRRDVDSALQNRRVDFNNRQHMEALMEQLGKANTEASIERVIDKVEETDLNEDKAERTGRLKVKAKRKAKSSRA